MNFKMSGQLTRGEKLDLIIGGILFGIFNNVTTIWNAKVLLDDGNKGMCSFLPSLMLKIFNNSWHM